MATETTEQLVAQYATTAQNRALAALIESRINKIKEQLTQCDAAELGELQGRVKELRGLLRNVQGSPH